MSTVEPKPNQQPITGRESFKRKQLEIKVKKQVDYSKREKAQLTKSAIGFTFFV